MFLSWVKWFLLMGSFFKVTALSNILAGAHPQISYLNIMYIYTLVGVSLYSIYNYAFRRRWLKCEPCALLSALHFSCMSYQHNALVRKRYSIQPHSSRHFHHLLFILNRNGKHILDLRKLSGADERKMRESDLGVCSDSVWDRWEVPVPERQKCLMKVCWICVLGFICMSIG